MDEREASADATRRRLLEAAGQVFAEKGFTAASIGEITEKAGANRAAVNYHFRSKEQLYVEAVRHAAQGCDRIGAVPAFGPDTMPEEMLAGFIRAFLSRFLSPEVVPWHGELIMRELGQPTAGACVVFVQEFVRPKFEMLMGILKLLTPPDLPAIRLHLLGCSIVGQCLHYFHTRHVLPHLVGPEEVATYNLDRVSRHITDFSLAALRGLFPQR